MFLMMNAFGRGMVNILIACFFRGKTLGSCVKVNKKSGDYFFAKLSPLFG
jgi:hypothetical protein